MIEPLPYPWYDRWSALRLKAIREHYGEVFLKGKRILEVGCGLSGIGMRIADLGADVTCSDGREELLEKVREIRPEVKVVLCDLDRGFPESRYDLVLSLGVLYHLESPIRHIRQACSAADHVVLETECWDRSEPAFLMREEEGVDQALNGIGVFPTTSLVEAVLAKEGMTFEIVKDGRCNSNGYKYDWTPTGSGSYGVEYRRLWFAWRK